MIDGLGERLKTAFKKKKVTMNECAKALKLAQTTLSGYVTGSTDPTATKLLHIAKYLGVSVDWLMGLSNDMHSDKAKFQKQAVPNQPKTRIIERTVYITPNMTEKDKINFVAEYIGFTKEAIRALHNARAIKIKWIESR